MEDITDPAREELERLIAKVGTQKAAADKLGLSTSVVNDIVLGRRPISRNVLGKLGYERVTIHVKSERLPRLMKAIEKVI